MFDMTKIGKKISQMRKDKGLTQMALADQLGVTFQAVSNWERGSTMPDISKLPELAEIFGISIEELLCDERKGKIVEELAKGETPKNVQVEELAEVAPIIKPEQFAKTYEQMSNDGVIDLKNVIKLAPIMDDDLLATIVKSNLENGATIKDVLALAPFLDEVHLGEIAREYVNKKTSIKDIVELAPFLDEAALREIVEKLLTNGADFSDIAGLAPFMDEDDLNSIASEYLKKGGNFNDLYYIAPFLDMNEFFRRFYKK